MPETSPKSKKKGDVFGLPWWGWAASLGGAILVYVLYKKHEADVAADDATTSTATTGGDTIPSGDVPGAASPTQVTYDTLEQWEAAALSYMTGNGQNAADALNNIGDWLNGSCVDQSSYNNLSGALQSIGLPPGFTTLPTLSVCAGTTTTTTTTGKSTGSTSTTVAGVAKAPALPTSLKAAMTNNGESVIASDWDSALNEWVYLTNKGGVYTLNKNGTTTGTTFYGSYLGLPADLREGTRTIEGLVINKNGTYTITSKDAAGKTQDYTFTPTTPQATAPKTPAKKL